MKGVVKTMPKRYSKGIKRVLKRYQKGISKRHKKGTKKTTDIDTFLIPFWYPSFTAMSF